MIVGQSNFLQALGWAVLNSLWQMAFLWVIYQIISGIYRSAKSSQKSYLATGLILFGFTWFIYTFFSILFASPANNVISPDFIGGNGNERLNTWLNTMLPIASIIYLALLLLPVFYFIHNYRYVQTIRHNQLSKVDVDWRIFVKNVAARMGIKKPVRIWLSGIVTSPVTIGYLKPVILLPVAAINQLSTQQLEAVLLHELAHIRRYDYLVNLIIRIIQTILYFNPFVKALVKTVEMEREKSCDEMVIQFQYDPHGYATALLMLEKLSYLPRPLAVAAAGKKSDLLNRIECVLGVQKKQVISFNKIAGLFAGLLCFIAVNALLIANKPGKTTGETASLTDMSSPLYFFTESDKGTKASKPVSAPQETIARSIVNHARPIGTETTAQKDAATPEPEIEEFALAQYKFAKLVEPAPGVPAIKELKAYQEQQVKEALDASKKILEQKQWKDVEKNIADVMTEEEKDVLKCQYEKELSKVDWTKMKQKLSLAYDKIDWTTINDNLSSALVEIKLDSLQQVYVQTMTELSVVQNQLCENNLKAIPDTDVSLESIEQNKKKVQKALNTLHKVKARKIIHL
ncbi:MAG TPA: M56 family metallopeptidase [Chitinophagaceae bacterium]|nr:M56 family metallopeptidase [Chitinophagaceae bacterium]